MKIETSSQIELLLSANTKLNEGLITIITQFSNIYKSYSKEACYLLSKIIADYFNNFNLSVNVFVEQDILENIKIHLEIKND